MLKKADMPTALTNAASHILKATVTADAPLRVRRKSTLAQSGELEYWHETDEAEAALQDSIQNKNGKWWERDTRAAKAAYARLKPEVAAALLAAGNLRLHRTSGCGELLLGNEGGDVTVFCLTEATIVVLKQAQILAHSGSLVATLEKAVPKDLAAVLETPHAWVIRGSGELATATSGEVVVLDMTPDRPMLIEAEAILAYTDTIDFTTPENYRIKLAERRVAQTLKLLPYNIDVGRRRVWFIAQGQGNIIIQSSD